MPVVVAGTAQAVRAVLGNLRDAIGDGEPLPDYHIHMFFPIKVGLSSFCLAVAPGRTVGTG